MKKSIKRIFKNIGLEVRRVPKPPVANKEPKQYTIVFGPYSLKTDNESLSVNYIRHPENNQVLARLGRLVSRHFPLSGIIDIGANCGDTGALLRSVCSLPILCVEGDPHLLQQLVSNTAPWPDITILPEYLGEHTQEVAMEIQKQGWNNTLVPKSGTGKSVTLRRLDEITIPWLKEHAVSFLKCDTEGFDNAILFGARGLLSRDHPVLLFEYNRENMQMINEDGLRIFPYLEQLDYDLLIFYDDGGRMILSTDTHQTSLIRDVHDYADGEHGIYYYDIVAFPRKLYSVAEEFLAVERAHRANPTSLNRNGQ